MQSKPEQATRVTDEILNETVKSDKKKFKKRISVVSSAVNKPETVASQPVTRDISQGPSRTTPMDRRRSEPIRNPRPWQRRKIHPLQKLLGETATRFSGQKVNIKTVANDCREGVFAVYVSAHWCPPCRMFTPMLLMTYEHLKQDKKKFEVVFVSCDIEETSYKEYFKHMPWLAVPWNEEKLGAVRNELGISGIPALLFMEPTTGAVWARNGVQIVKADPRAELFPWRDFPKDLLRTGGFAGIPNLAKKLMEPEENEGPDDDKQLTGDDVSEVHSDKGLSQ